MTEIETLVIYAGTMRAILAGNKNRESFIGESQLSTFKNLTPSMTSEMREILFPILTNWISLKRDDLIGSMPALHTTPRLHPMFYYLADLRDMFYTVDDTFVKMSIKGIPKEQLNQDLMDEAIGGVKIRDISEKLDSDIPHKLRVSLTAELEGLKEAQKHRDERKRLRIYTPGTEFEIEYMDLETISITKDSFDGKSARERILQAVKPHIYSTLELLSSAGIKVMWNSLTKSATIIRPKMNHFYNHQMDMLSTFNLVANHRETIVHKGHNREIQPFSRLRKQFLHTMDLYKRALQQEGQHPETPEESDSKLSEGDESDEEGKWKMTQTTTKKKKIISSQTYLESNPPEDNEFLTLPQLAIKFNEIWANAASVDYHRQLGEQKSFSVIL
jgi:hypothetical protein